LALLNWWAEAHPTVLSQPLWWAEAERRPAHPAKDSPLYGWRRVGFSPPVQLAANSRAAAAHAIETTVRPASGLQPSAAL